MTAHSRAKLLDYVLLNIVLLLCCCGKVVGLVFIIRIVVRQILCKLRQNCRILLILGDCICDDGHQRVECR